MPKSSKSKLEYQKQYNAQEEQKDKRVANNRARRHAIAAGTASKGDGTNVDHKRPLDKGGSTADSNTRVISEATNKGWRKDHPDMYGKGKK
jgi:hypothetical protein